jgi:hypothetical protein
VADDRPMYAATCDDHTYGPNSYTAWHDWAEKMAETHVQTKCPECGLWMIWTPRGSGRAEVAAEAAQSGSSGSDQ